MHAFFQLQELGQTGKDTDALKNTYFFKKKKLKSVKTIGVFCSLHNTYFANGLLFIRQNFKAKLPGEDFRITFFGECGRFLF